MNYKKLFVIPMILALAACGPQRGDTGSSSTTSGTTSEEVLPMAGDGTISNPYVITKASHFVEIAAKTFAFKQYYVLDNDIDFNGAEVTPIGSSANPFNGVLDGRGHTIKNYKLSTQTSDNYIGFFGYTKNGSISNVHFEEINLNLTVLGKKTNVIASGVVGLADNTVIQNVHASYTKFNIASAQNGNSALIAGGITGGLIAGTNVYMPFAYNSVEGTIDLDFSNASDTNGIAGGLIGQAAAEKTGQSINAIYDCAFYGSIHSLDYAAGIVGYIPSLSSVQNCITVGEEIIASSETGGIAGGLVAYASYETLIANSYSGYTTISSPEAQSSSYYKSFASLAVGCPYEGDYQDFGAQIESSSVMNCAGFAGTITANYVKTDGIITAALSKPLLTSLKFSEKVWNLDGGKPTIVDNPQAKDIEITLDNLNGEEAVKLTSKAGDYNAAVISTILNSKPTKEGYSFYSYVYGTGEVTYRWYAPFMSDMTLSAGYGDLSQLIGDYSYVCYYYGEALSYGKGNWKFDQNYFYWVNMDNWLFVYEYTFTGKYVIIGQQVENNASLPSYYPGMFMWYEDGKLCCYDANSDDAIYKADKVADGTVKIPNHEGKAYLGEWFGTDGFEMTIYKDGNIKSDYTATSQVKHWGAVTITSDGQLSVKLDTLGTTVYTYNQTYDVLVGESRVCTREAATKVLKTDDNSARVVVTESHTYILSGTTVVANSYEGSLEAGQHITIAGVEYEIKANGTLNKVGGEPVDPVDPVDPVVTNVVYGTWTGKVGFNDTTVIINEDNTGKFNSTDVTWSVSGNVYSATVGDYEVTCTYNQEKQQLAVRMEDSYEGYVFEGTLTTYAPIEKEEEPSDETPEYVGTYTGTIAFGTGSVTLNADGTGVLALADLRVNFNYVVESNGNLTLSNVTYSDDAWDCLTLKYSSGKLTGTIEYDYDAKQVNLSK